MKQNLNCNNEKKKYIIILRYGILNIILKLPLSSTSVFSIRTLKEKYKKNNHKTFMEYFQFQTHTTIHD